MHCAKEALEKVGFHPDEHIISKDLKISKNFDLNSSTDLERMKEAIVEKTKKVYDK